MYGSQLSAVSYQLLAISRWLLVSFWYFTMFA